MVKIIKYWELNKDGNAILKTYIKENFYVRARLRPPARFSKPIHKCSIDRLRKENSNLAL